MAAPSCTRHDHDPTARDETTKSTRTASAAAPSAEVVPLAAGASVAFFDAETSDPPSK